MLTSVAYFLAFQVNGRQLTIRGIRLGVVKGTTCNFSDVLHNQSLDELLTIAYNTTPAKPNTDDRLEVLFSAMNTEHFETWDPAFGSYNRDKDLEKFANWVTRMTEESPGQKDLPETLSQLSPLPSRSSREYRSFLTIGSRTLARDSPSTVNTPAAAEADGKPRYYYPSQTITSHRRLALLALSPALSPSPQYLPAVVPLSTCPGDEIWLLFNGRVAYVLRPSQHVLNEEEVGEEMRGGMKTGYYRYLGEAYAHRFMRGEVFDGVTPAEEDERGEVRIEICVIE
jgi:hypothetical protein